LQTIDLTAQAKIELEGGPVGELFAVSCSVVRWDDASKGIGVNGTVKRIDQAWKKWKSGDGAAWNYVNDGEKFDMNGKKATNCCAKNEGRFGNCDDTGPSSLLTACYSEVVRQCVRHDDVRLITDSEFKHEMNVLFGQVSPAARETALQQKIDSLNTELQKMGQRVKTLEEAGRPVK
jgi:hypothetical protein